MKNIILALVLIFLSSPAMAEVLINIDKTKQQMTVVVDGEPTYDWKVSTGKRGYDTPSGIYTAQSMNEMWYSKQWDNAPMPHAIFFMKDGHAIHGTLEEKYLGRAASHGCVRISKKDATILFDLVKEQGLDKTQVIVTGQAAYADVPETAHRTKPKAKPQKRRNYPQQRPAPFVPFDPYHGFRGGY
jgi:hypothetical protein